MTRIHVANVSGGCFVSGTGLGTEDSHRSKRTMGPALKDVGPHLGETHIFGGAVGGRNGLSKLSLSLI